MCFVTEFCLQCTSSIGIPECILAEAPEFNAACQAPAGAFSCYTRVNEGNRLFIDFLVNDSQSLICHFQLVKSIAAASIDWTTQLPVSVTPKHAARVQDLAAMAESSHQTAWLVTFAPETLTQHAAATSTAPTQSARSSVATTNATSPDLMATLNADAYRPTHRDAKATNSATSATEMVATWVTTTAL